MTQLVIHASYLHPRDDSRIWGRHVRCLEIAGASETKVTVISRCLLGEEEFDCISSSASKWVRFFSTVVKLFSKRFTSRLSRSEVLIFLHDPALLVIAPVLAVFSRVVFDAHEDLPKQIFHNPKYKLLAHPLAFLFKPILYCLTMCCERTLVVVPPMMTRWYFVRPVLVPNFPVEDRAIRANGKRRFIYIGGLSEARGLRDLLEFGVKCAESSIEFLVAGFASESDAAILRERTNRYFRFLGALSHEEVNKILSEGGIGICFIGKYPAYEESYPVKIVDYLCYGLPFVSTPIPFACTLVDRFGCGRIIGYDEIASLDPAEIFMSIPIYNKNLEKFGLEIGELLSFPIKRYLKIVFNG